MLRGRRPRAHGEPSCHAGTYAVGRGRVGGLRHVDMDGASREIVSGAADALTKLVRDLREALGVDGPVVLAGGLLLNQPRLEAALRERLTSPCIRLVEPPVEGALRLAEELLRA